MATYLVYRFAATALSEKDRPFVADLSLMTFENGAAKSITFPTLAHGSQTITLTSGTDGWTGDNGYYKARLRIQDNVSNSTILVGLLTRKSNNAGDVFFAQAATVNLELPNGTYTLYYAWQADSFSKELTLALDGTKKTFTHHRYDASSASDPKVVAKNDGPQAPGRFTTVETTQDPRLIHGWAVPFKDKTALVGYVTRPSGGAQNTRDTYIEPGDPVEPFVAIG